MVFTTASFHFKTNFTSNTLSFNFSDMILLQLGQMLSDQTSAPITTRRPQPDFNEMNDFNSVYYPQKARVTRRPPPKRRGSVSIYNFKTHQTNLPNHDSKIFTQEFERQTFFHQLNLLVPLVSLLDLV